MITPHQVFSELVATAPREPGRAYRSFAGPEGLHTRAFVDGLSRLPGISFRAPRDRVPAGIDVPRMKGAHLSVIPEVRGKVSEVTYELCPSDDTFVEVFVELAASLVTDATQEKTAEAALMAMARRMATWVRFFDARGQEGLGRSAQLGLIGELLCLRRLGSLIGLSRATHAWTGPLGTPHDFQIAAGAIEAKLSTSAAPERFRVTSERQLDDSVVPCLLMFAVVAQEAVSGAVSLSSLVDHLRNLLSETTPITGLLFEERLLDLGYIDRDRPLYGVRLTVREERFLLVTGDFPRIRPGELRPGVFKVAYDIPWAAIAPYNITDNDVRRRLGE